MWTASDDEIHEDDTATIILTGQRHKNKRKVILDAVLRWSPAGRLVCVRVCVRVSIRVCVCTDRNRLHWKKKKKRKAFEMKTNSKKFATSRASFGAHDDNDVDEWDKWRRQKTFRIFSAASSSSLFLFLLLLLFLIVTVVLTDVGKGLTEG